MGQVCGKSDKNTVKPENQPKRRKTIISPSQIIRNNSDTITVLQEGNLPASRAESVESAMESYSSFCPSQKETGGDWSHGFREDMIQGYIPNPVIAGGKIEEKNGDSEVGENCSLILTSVEEFSQTQVSNTKSFH